MSRAVRSSRKAARQAAAAACDFEHALSAEIPFGIQVREQQPMPW